MQDNIILKGVYRTYIHTIYSRLERTQRSRNNDTIINNAIYSKHEQYCDPAGVHMALYIYIYIYIIIYNNIIYIYMYIMGRSPSCNDWVGVGNIWTQIKFVHKLHTLFFYTFLVIVFNFVLLRNLATRGAPRGGSGLCGALREDERLRSGSLLRVRLTLQRPPRDKRPRSGSLLRVRLRAVRGHKRLTAGVVTSLACETAAPAGVASCCRIHNGARGCSAQTTKACKRGWPMDNVPPGACSTNNY